MNFCKPFPHLLVSLLALFLITSSTIAQETDAEAPAVTESVTTEATQSVTTEATERTTVEPPAPTEVRINQTEVTTTPGESTDNQTMLIFGGLALLLIVGLMIAMAGKKNPPPA